MSPRIQYWDNPADSKLGLRLLINLKTELAESLKKDIARCDHEIDADYLKSVEVVYEQVDGVIDEAIDHLRKNDLERLVVKSRRLENLVSRSLIMHDDHILSADATVRNLSSFKASAGD